MYSCSLKGHCESDYAGQYRSEAECAQHCVGIDHDQYELIMTVIDYDPEKALNLSSSDTIYYLSTRYGIQVDESQSQIIMVKILQEDWFYLYLQQNNSIRDYLATFLDDLDYLILDTWATISYNYSDDKSLKIHRGRLLLYFRALFNERPDTSLNRTLHREGLAPLERIDLIYFIQEDIIMRLRNLLSQPPPPGRLEQLVVDYWPKLIQMFGRGHIPYEHLIVVQN